MLLNSANRKILAVDLQVKSYVTRSLADSIAGPFLFMGNLHSSSSSILSTVLMLSRLTSGSCLLLAGSIADVVGSRPIFLLGCFLLSCFILACGLARTGIQLIMFRAMQGIAVALCLPTSVAILTNAIASGKRRNIGFACMGLGQPLGFSLGLVLGGVFVDTIGWRAGWYICAGALLVCLLVGSWSLPLDSLTQPPSWKRLRDDVDWLGAIIATACLAMLAYVLV